MIRNGLSEKKNETQKNKIKKKKKKTQTRWPSAFCVSRP